MAKYLKAKARGASRQSALREAGATWNPSGLIGMEHNALVYAGHTVWNRHSGDGAKKRYRPREEWIIQRDTHPALIADAEAEAILYQLKTSTIGAAVSLAKQGMSRYLLVGLLRAPDGRLWVGHGGKNYRLKPADDRPGKYLSREEVDESIKRQVIADLQSGHLAKDLAKAAKAERQAEDDGSADRAEVERLEKQIDRTIEMASHLEDPSTVLRKVDELERTRKGLLEEIAKNERARVHESAIDTLDEKKISALIASMADDLELLSFERWRELLAALVTGIDLDPVTLECRIRYRIAQPDSLSGASPRGLPGWVIQPVKIARKN